MPRRWLLLPSLGVLFCGSAMAQGSRVTLRIVVTYEGEQQPVQDELTLQIMDGWGAIEEEQHTTHGMVQFLTESGVHRLRILGNTIDEFYTEFTLRRDESTHSESYQVRRKNYTYGLTFRKGTIPAVRLKIPRDAEREFERGARAIDKKKWAEARESFTHAIALYPEYDMAYNGLGIAALNSRDVEGARNAFEKAISLNDSYADAYRNLARILMSESKYEDVDGALKKALKSEPLDPWTLTYAAYAELLSGKFDEAVTTAQKVHSAPHAGFASAHVVAARAFELTHRPSQALAEYQLYLKEDPRGRDAKSAHEAEVRLTASHRPPGD